MRYTYTSGAYMLSLLKTWKGKVLLQCRPACFLLSMRKKKKKVGGQLLKSPQCKLNFNNQLKFKVYSLNLSPPIPNFRNFCRRIQVPFQIKITIKKQSSNISKPVTYFFRGTADAWKLSTFCLFMKANATTSMVVYHMHTDDCTCSIIKWNISLPSAQILCNTSSPLTNQC